MRVLENIQERGEVIAMTLGVNLVSCYFSILKINAVSVSAVFPGLASCAGMIGSQLWKGSIFFPRSHSFLPFHLPLYYLCELWVPTLIFILHTPGELSPKSPWFPPLAPPALGLKSDHHPL